MERDQHADTIELPVEVASPDAAIRGVLHLPSAPVAGLALAHGAGGNADSPMLRLIAEQLAARQVAVLRYNLPYRVKRASGPPHRSAAAADRQGIRLAADVMRERVGGPVLIGGHSYGGRQASMLAAEYPGVAHGLVLFSYPLHPPGKPERARTEHLPGVTVPALFIHGDRDPFGSLEELRAALVLLPGHTRLLEVTGTGHDLGGGKKKWVVEEAASAVIDTFGLQ